MSEQSIEESAKALNDASKLQTKDLSEMASKYLSDKSKESLSKKSNTQILVDKDGEAYICIYLGKVIRNDRVEVAVEMIAQKVNKLSELGLIHSALAPISQIELVSMPMRHPLSAVLCFVLVPAKRKDEAETLCGDLVSREGEMPNTDDDFYKELPEGQFYAEVRISAFSAVQRGETSPSKEILDDVIEQCLAVLPKGTSVIEIRQCAILDLSVPFEVIFYNPMLPSIKQVELEHVRWCERVKDEIKQFNLLIGVKYIARDGKIIPERN